MLENLPSEARLLEPKWEVIRAGWASGHTTTGGSSLGIAVLGGDDRSFVGGNVTKHWLN